jgi:hypothetical protein
MVGIRVKKGVVHLVTARQPNQLFTERFSVGGRHHHGISDYVIHERRTRRRKKPQVAHLYWCWTQSRNLKAIVVGMAHQIDKDIGLAFVDQLRGALA